jgi:hypothetical protein
METPTLRPKRDRRGHPRIPPHHLTRSTPEAGDIVVREEKREGTLVYVLHTAPGAHQRLLRSRREAIAEALASAWCHHIRAWLTDEGPHFTLLEDFRVVTTIDDVLNRLRAEFLEMPGLRLKPEQVRRLCGIDLTSCQVALDVLVGEKFLGVTVDGHYARLTTGYQPRPAKADLRTAKRDEEAS